jgi:hypothetical protein
MAEIDEVRDVSTLDNTKQLPDTEPIGEEKDIPTLKARIATRLSEATGFFNDIFDKNFRLFYNQYRIMKTEPKKDWHSDQVLPIIFGSIETKKSAIMEQLIPETMFYALLPQNEGSPILDALGKPVLDPQTQKPLAYDADMSARAMEQLIRIYLDRMDFFTHVDWNLTDAMVFKYAPFYLGWKYVEGIDEYFDIKKGEVVKITDIDAVLVDEPECEAISPFDFFIDPKAKSVQTARYIFRRIMINADEVEGSPQVFHMPDAKQFLADCKDKNIEEVEGYEYWEKNGKRNRVATITKDKKLLLRNHINPNKHKKYPFFVNTEFSLQRSVYGMSSAELLSDIQIYESSLTNIEADQALLNVISPLIVEDGTDISSKNMALAPGKPIVVPIGRLDSLKQFKSNPIGEDGDRMFARLEAVTHKAVGNTEYMNPMPNMPGNNVNGTATGANIINQNIMQRNVAGVKAWRQKFMKPFLKMLVELIQQYQDPKKAMEILGEKKAKALKIEANKIDWKADYEYQVLGEDGRLTKMQLLQSSMSLAQMIGMFPEMKQFIHADKFARHTLGYYGLPEDVIATEEEVKELERAQQEQQNANTPPSPNEQAALNNQVKTIMQTKGVDERTALQEIGGQTPQNANGGSNVWQKRIDGENGSGTKETDTD